MGFINFLKSKWGNRKDKINSNYLKGIPKDKVMTTGTATGEEEKKEEFVPEKSFEKYVEKVIADAKSTGRIFKDDEEAKQWAIRKITKKMDKYTDKIGKPITCSICNKYGVNEKTGGYVKNKDGSYAHFYCTDKGKQLLADAVPLFKPKPEDVQNLCPVVTSKIVMDPDRICPKCGGYKWKTIEKGRKFMCRGKIRINDNKWEKCDQIQIFVPLHEVEPEIVQEVVPEVVQETVPQCHQAVPVEDNDTSETLKEVSQPSQEVSQ